jgi:Flp pilus assembly protein TadD
MGAALLKRGAPGGALLVARKALVINNKDAANYLLLAYAHHHRGEQQSALRACQQALEKDPGNASARKLLQTLSGTQQDYNS